MDAFLADIRTAAAAEALDDLLPDADDDLLRNTAEAMRVDPGARSSSVFFSIMENVR